MCSQLTAIEKILGDVGMFLDAGKAQSERRDEEITESDVSGADEDEAALEGISAADGPAFHINDLVVDDVNEGIGRKPLGTTTKIDTGGAVEGVERVHERFPAGHLQANFAVYEIENQLI